MNTKRLIFLVPIVAAMAGLLLFQWIGATAAAPTSCTITVTNSNDSGAGSLRQAVADVCDGGTVTFDPTLDGQTVTLTNQITITRLITVTGETLDITISGNNATRHFEVTATGGLMLDRLTLRDGSADFGGSIFNQGNITITQTDLVSNTATGNGGALVNQGTATVEQTTFANNHSNERGGAIFTNGGTLTIRDSRIEVNSADFNGGAIRLAGGSNSAEISNTDILSNTAAQQGGAIFADVDSTLTLRESRVLGNMATGEGGALVNQGPTTIEQTTFAHNHSDNRGGAIFTDGGTLTIRDSRIEANSAGSTGGGIRLTSPVGQFNSAEINNTDIISNTAAQDGGAIFTFARSTLTLRDSRILGNTATGNGGALVNQGPATIEQTTFANNHSNERGGAIYRLGGTLTIRDSRIEANSADFNGGAIRLAGGNNSTEISNTDIISNTAAQQGGAIFADVNSTLTLRDSRVLGNTATSDGGALVTQRTATIEQTTFARNRSGNRGGAIFTDGGTLTMRDSRLEANRASASGGAIRLSAFSGSSISAEISNTDFISNTAALGGAISSDENSTLTLRDSRVLGNTAAPASGGALFTQGSTTIEQTTFADNHTAGVGGAIGASNGTLVIRDSRLEANSADIFGGAIGLLASSGQSISAEISNTDILSNTTAQRGGAIFSDDDSTLTLRDSRVFSNTATGNGGGLHNQGPATVEQTTFANNHSDDRGGAIFTDGGTLTMRDSHIEANSADFNGGAIRLSGQNNSAEISNTNIISNTTAQEGGAIFSDADSTLTLRDSRVLSNTATGNGGALYNQGEATIEQTTFANNHSDERGGALLNDGGTLVVRDSRMEVNSASVNGGAIRLLGSGNSAEISNTDIVSNTAGNGGGIFTDGNSTLILRQSNVSHNSVATGSGAGSGAGSGGGLTVEGAATIEQSTIAHNSAGRLGGGIYFQRFNTLSRLTLVNSTVSGNSAEIGTNDTTSGSGIGANASIAVINSSIVNNGGAGSGINMTNGGRVTLTNSIVANNAIRDCASSLSTISHSLIADGSCGISDGVNGNIVADPQLGPLADSGGPTPTHALLSNSPAIGAADQTVCDAASVNSLDQRNAPRTAPCDIGAFEFGSVPTAVGLGVQQTTDGKAAVLPLLVLVVMTGIVCVRRGEMVSAELPRQHDTT